MELLRVVAYFLFSLAGFEISQCASVKKRQASAECPSSGLDFEIANGQATAKSLEIGSVLKYKCYLGFNLENGNRKRKCVLEGDTAVWNRVKPECTAVSVTCPSSEAALLLPNGEVKNTGGIQVGSVLTYLCNDGFLRVNGDKKRKCILSEDGQSAFWDGTIPECEAFTPECPGTGTDFEIPNGEAEATGTTVGSVLHYSCPDGFILENGDRKRKCVADGDQAVWNGAKPECSEPFTLSDEFVTHENQKCVDLTVQGYMTAEDCKDSCVQNKECRGVSVKKPFCRTHTSCSLTFSDHQTVYVKDEGYAEHYGMKCDSDGNHEGNFFVMDCISICNSSSECAAVRVRSYDQLQCLHCNSTLLQKHLEYTSYIKAPTPTPTPQPTPTTNPAPQPTTTATPQPTPQPTPTPTQQPTPTPAA